MIAKRMLSLILLYLLLLLIVFLFQRKLIYLPSQLEPERQQELAQQLNLKLWPTNDDYLGLISQTPSVADKGTIVVFHGNAGSAINRIYYLQALEKLGYRVILAEYPGYGARAGDPSETVLVSNGIATVKQALHDFGGPIFLWGESLGGGVVSGIVASGQVPVKGIALVTPFDSLANVAHHHYRFLLARWLLRDQFDNVENLRHYTGNTAVVLAEADEIIPVKYGENLFDSLQHPKKRWIFKNASHNNLPLAPGLPWWQEVMQFVSD
ncbi:alpha/beta hydrolase [Methylobacter sp. sgz302048]|uniref:alpha/beta hydrolase n=1 Tax=Methylobacter sp. sgz302048 TaxID=3455945 RepID=UPI003FA0F0B6